MAKSLFKTASGKNYLFPFILITSLFFLWGMAHSLLDILNKHFQDALHLVQSIAAPMMVTNTVGAARIYYVSDRTNENKTDTLNTLKSLGLPQVSEESVLLDTGTKEERRQAIMKNQQIIMLFGDSLPDFAAQFKNKKPTEEQRQLVESNAQHFGVDWIVLPNAAYGSWSKAKLDSWKTPAVK